MVCSHYSLLRCRLVWLSTLILVVREVYFDRQATGQAPRAEIAPTQDDLGPEKDSP